MTDAALTQTSWKSLLLQISKRLWLGAVVAGVGVYLAQNRDVLQNELQAIPLWSVAVSLGLLIIGRLILAEVTRQSAKLFDWSPSYRQILHFYAVSQLARYLPGGIWHFVGMAGFYRANGLPLKKASRAILIEYMWLALGAGAMGVAFFAYYSSEVNIAIIGVAILIGWGAALWLVNAFMSQRTDFKPIVVQIVLHGLIWTIMGASFRVLLPQKDIPDLFALSSGAFSLGWVVGFIVIFAPGGIGVREAVITALLSVVIQPEVAIVYATAHRILFVIADIAVYGLDRGANLTLKPVPQQQTDPV
jgi:hypothetical protein